MPRLPPGEVTYCRLWGSALPRIGAASSGSEDDISIVKEISMIRIAAFDDLPEIVAIYNEAVAHRFATADLKPVTVDQRVAWFREHDSATFPIYVFENEGSVR